MSLELRCSRVAKAAGYLPGGTAAGAEAFVLVEAPLPWPNKVETHFLLAPLARILKDHGARLQAVVPQGDTPGLTRIVVYRRDPDALSFGRDEATVPTGELEERLTALLAHDDLGEPPKSGSGVTDVLICTHGSRDRCCGADGMRLYVELLAMALPGVRLWRTSHTGGHRFAPTGLTFPDGRAWAWLDAELVRRIVEQDLTPDEIAAHDRGSVGLLDPYAQAAEGAVFARVGWPWLDAARTAVVQAPANGGPAQVLVTGAGRHYEVEVAIDRMVPVPECGLPLTEARKDSPEMVVRSLGEVAEVRGGRRD